MHESSDDLTDSSELDCFSASKNKNAKTSDLLRNKTSKKKKHLNYSKIYSKGIISKGIILCITVKSLPYITFMNYVNYF